MILQRPSRRCLCSALGLVLLLSSPLCLAGQVATIVTLRSFNNADGASPEVGLTPGDDGFFYGTTYQGGSSGYGTVFAVTTNGALTSLVSFTNGNGAYPKSGLTCGADGAFYGTTFLGGSSGQVTGKC